MRRQTLVGMGFWLLAAAMLMTMFAARARAQGEDEAWQAFHGQMVISDIMIAPADAFESGATMVSALHKAERTTVGARDGFWRLHAVAFLDPAATGALRMRALDVTAPNQREQVKVFDLAGQAGQKILPVADLVLTGAMGFKPGHRYELSIEPAPEEAGTGSPSGIGAAAAAGGGTSASGVGGKTAVYAKGMITLK
jgi:hypothetical protein